MAVESKFDQIAARFEVADRADLTKEEWDWLAQAWADRSRLQSENGILRRELDRVRRIARPLWRTARRLQKEMQGEISAAVVTHRHILPERVGGWSIDLAMVLDIDVRDAPAGHRKHREFKR